MSSQCAQAAGIGPARSLERTNRTRFPFFSDVKGDHRLVLSAVETVVLALIFAVSLLGNVCALVLVARRRRRGTTASLVLNLFCADLLFTSAIPPVLAVRWTEAWVLGPGACHLLFYVMTLSGSVTILTLAAVSLERMVCIVRLQRGVRRPGRRARAALLALIWGYSAFAALPLCIFFRVVQQRFSGADEEIPICTLVWPSIAGEISWDVSFVTLNFLVPGLLIVISYSKILQVCLLQAPLCFVFLQITKASRRRLTMTLASSESHQLRVSQQDVRLFRTLFLLMISFFVMWSPIIVTILLILIQNFEQNLVIWPSLFFWVVAFTFANSAVNPILYNMSLFRNEWRKFFHCFFFSEKGAMFTDTSVRRNDLSVISS
ncbi:free fatty acid receptor 4 isoform X1 [Neophocaena asiaeorientalis asiaeorientalis]|uniref:Free fatty acid receptor 4 n=1 Tax=Neophocaena asiaeorientalis asiaeorientalis TaxID=1706337 RepID=A0A341AZ71_NEOAA|nr:free fatty acid receptor 4 isoform X1 [Neophocaena asiaeorientalis asiaeorientalis]XP_032465132.1 free fatty acid receptor 4 isoform X1 [Phocoena sinus]